MLNKAILMGRLTADPELRHTQNNIPVTSFTLAVDRTFGQDKQTDFLDIVAWRNTAEFVSKWFRTSCLWPFTDGSRPVPGRISRATNANRWKW